MGFYLRKALSVGPLRFNLSQSGIGVSVGVPGFRVGMGPRGNYVHMGRGGLYYRQTLSPGSSGRPGSSPQLTEHTQSHGQYVEIESADVSQMVDSSSSDLLAELNSKRRRMRIWPFIALGAPVGAGVLAAAHLPGWMIVVELVVGLVAVVGMSVWDALKKSTVIFYDLESAAVEAYQQIHDGFGDLRSSAAMWHIGSQANVHDRKYHAGASTLVKRVAIRAGEGALPFVKINVQVPTLPVGRQTLAFLPDRVLVFDPSGVGAVEYADLRFEVGQTRFIEEGVVPHDSTVVDQTWKYVNKRGGPDRRFNNNRQLPIALYEEVSLRSASGLNEVVQISKVGASARLVAAVARLADEVARSRGAAATTGSSAR